MVWFHSNLIENTVFTMTFHLFAAEFNIFLCVSRAPAKESEEEYDSGIEESWPRQADAANN